MYNKYSIEDTSRVKKASKGTTFISVLFLILGIAFIVASIFYKNNNDKFMANAKSVEAEITKIELEKRNTNKHNKTEKGVNYSAYVSYTVDGQYYENVKLEYYSTDMKKGQKIKVFYEEGNPRNIRTKFGSTAVVYVGIGVGILLGCLGGYFTIYNIKRSIKEKKGDTVKTENS